jgi:hypothetical protein
MQGGDLPLRDCLLICADGSHMTQHGEGSRLVTPLKDPAIAKYAQDFNRENGTHDKGGLALICLLAYCMSHGATRLAEISADEVIAEMRAQRGLDAGRYSRFEQAAGGLEQAIRKRVRLGPAMLGPNCQGLRRWPYMRPGR